MDENSIVSKKLIKLLSGDFLLLKKLGAESPFEICMRANDWIWLKAHNVKGTVYNESHRNISMFVK